MTRRRRPRTSEERLVAAVGSVARGVVGGRIRNVRQAAPLERNTGGPVATGGFDPNADPVIIGLSAAATGSWAVAIGRAASAVAATVAIGYEATATSSGAIAIGYNNPLAQGTDSIAFGTSAWAQASDSVAIGHFAKTGTGATTGIAVGANALARGSEDIAIGSGAVTAVGSSDAVAIGTGANAALNSSAIGHWASASGQNAVAVGVGAGATYDSSTAIGQAATTTAANQIMLGTTSDYVEVPGNGVVLHDVSGGRWRLTVDTSGTASWAAA